MAFDDFLISTGVDNLIRLVKEKGRIEMGQAARELKLPQKTVEDWSHVLEEEGIVKLEYKLTKVYLAWQEPTKEYVAEKSHEIERRASSAKADLEGLLSKVEEGGRSLAAMQEEIAQAGAAPAQPAKTAELKSALSDLQKDYNSKITAAQDRLDKLRKKALSAASAPKEKEGAKKAPADADIEKELAVLHRLEETLESQLADTESFFGDYESKLDDLKKGAEDDKVLSALDKYRSDLAEVRELKGELSEAIEAVSEEHKALEEKLGSLEGGIVKLKDAATPAGRAKKLAEIKRLGEEARRQKAAVNEQLQGALSALRRQTAKFEEVAKRQAESRGRTDQLKGEYMEIAEEIGRASVELSTRENDIAQRFSSQIAALQAGHGEGGMLSTEELKKVSFLLRELKREQALLEGKVRGLLKETEILKMETEETPGAPQQAKSQLGPEPIALVEKVRLSEGEALEFERKRNELRSLIQKMWEENKGGKQ